MIQQSDDVRQDVGVARELQELKGLLAELSNGAAAVKDDARRMAAIEAARLRIGFERGVANVITWSFVVIVCGLTGALAGARLVSGVAGAVGRATGEAWAGDLAAGLGVLGALSAGGLVFWRRRDAQRLAELERQFPEHQP